MDGAVGEIYSLSPVGIHLTVNTTFIMVITITMTIITIVITVTIITAIIVIDIVISIFILIIDSTMKPGCQMVGGPGKIYRLIYTQMKEM